MMNIAKNKKGFTLIELLVVVSIIGILSGIAIPFYSSYRAQAYDHITKGDLRNAMKFLDLYFLDNDTYPEESDDLLAAGFTLSKDVSFTSYSVGNFGDGQLTVHMHIQHSSSSNAWHANYPKEGMEIEIR